MNNVKLLISGVLLGFIATSMASANAKDSVLETRSISCGADLSNSMMDWGIGAKQLEKDATFVGAYYLKYRTASSGSVICVWQPAEGGVIEYGVIYTKCCKETAIRKQPVGDNWQSSNLAEVFEIRRGKFYADEKDFSEIKVCTANLNECKFTATLIEKFIDRTGDDSF